MRDLSLRMPRLNKIPGESSFVNDLVSNVLEEKLEKLTERGFVLEARVSGILDTKGSDHGRIKYL